MYICWMKSGVKFSAEEERIVIELQREFGNKWARIATYLPGRTDNDVKNFWSSRQKRLARILHNPPPPPPPPKHNHKKEPPSLHVVPTLEVRNFWRIQLISIMGSCSFMHLKFFFPLPMFLHFVDIFCRHQSLVLHRRTNHHPRHNLAHRPISITRSHSRLCHSLN